MLRITVDGFKLMARFEDGRSPQTVAAFRRLLPLDSKLIQARWSGQAAWIPFGELDLGIGFEDPTSYPGPGELLIYPGGVSETEILFPYGQTCVSSKAGQSHQQGGARAHRGLSRQPCMSTSYTTSRDLTLQREVGGAITRTTTLRLSARSHTVFSG
jgi:hypothetical protein